MLAINLRKKLWKKTLKAAEKRIGKEAWRTVHQIHEQISEWVHPAHILFSFCDKKHRERGLTTWRASKHSVLNEQEFLDSLSQPARIVEPPNEPEIVDIANEDGVIQPWIEAGY